MQSDDPDTYSATNAHMPEIGIDHPWLPLFAMEIDFTMHM